MLARLSRSFFFEDFSFSFTQINPISVCSSCWIFALYLRIKVISWTFQMEDNSLIPAYQKRIISNLNSFAIFKHSPSKCCPSRDPGNCLGRLATGWALAPAGAVALRRISWRKSFFLRSSRWGGGNLFTVCFSLFILIGGEMDKGNAMVAHTFLRSFFRFLCFCLVVRTRMINVCVYFPRVKKIASRAALNLKRLVEISFGGYVWPRANSSLDSLLIYLYIHTHGQRIFSDAKPHIITATRSAFLRA